MVISLLASGCDSLRYVDLQRDTSRPLRFFYDAEEPLVFNGVVLCEYEKDNDIEDNDIWVIYTSEALRTKRFVVQVGTVPSGWEQLYPADGSSPTLRDKKTYLLIAGRFWRHDGKLGFPGGFHTWAKVAFEYRADSGGRGTEEAPGQ